VGSNNRSELRARRTELSESLPELGRKRDQSYRLNGDVQALNRAGVTDHPSDEMARLGENQVEADAAIRSAQREIRSLDAEIASGRGLGARVGRALRRG
jgi:hypothetical protein